MLCDFHIHTSFSGDCRTPAVQQIEAAIRLGMDRICITDHHDYGDPFLMLELPGYVTALRELREQYRDRIQVELGIELGLQNRCGAELEEICRQNEFDFVIGSHHYVNGADPCHEEFWKDRDPEEAIRLYFAVVRSRAEKLDCYDALGHLDYITRYRPGDPEPFDPTPYREDIDVILKRLIEKGKALEVNTGGLRYPVRRTNPCEAILKRYRELGGELLTLGSDAHRSDQIGAGFRETGAMLKALGFRFYTAYHARTPEMLPLK